MVAMHELLAEWIRYIVPGIEAIGVVAVLWSVVEALANLAQRGRCLLTRRPVLRSLVVIRIAMGEKMVLGLEFFLAGDIIQTIVVPTWDSLATLGGIVVIRTVLVYFLNMELRQGAKPHVK